MKDLGHEGLVNMLAAYEDKSAQAVCTFAYCEGPGQEPVLFQGRTDVCMILPLLPPSFLFSTKRKRKRKEEKQDRADSSVIFPYGVYLG